MKAFATIAFALSTASPLFAQGLVNFANTPTTLISVQNVGGSTSVMSGPVGSFYFGLFLGIPNQSWSFTGIYATNSGVNGLFTGGVASVPGWAAGTSQNYFIAGWSGPHDFEGQWLSGNGLPAYFGLDGIGSGVAGNGTSIPTLNLFDGGSNTLQSGFILANHAIPEPSVASISSFGIALIVLQRLRRGNADHLIIHMTHFGMFMLMSFWRDFPLIYERGRFLGRFPD